MEGVFDVNRNMPRFAVLRHESPRGLHFDLLLETGDALQTWALRRPPDSGGEIPCDALPDHRVAYLDYEGPVSGDRGTVTRWDRGTYQTLRQDDSQWVVELDGSKLSGRAVLRRLPGDHPCWSFVLLGD